MVYHLSPDRREKNDIIKACVKYCVYLRDIPTDLLTTEEQDFMKTMAQIDAWYEAEMNSAELRGKLQGELEGKLEGELQEKTKIALNMMRENMPLEVIARLTGLAIDRLQHLRSNEDKNLI
jgi:predicted transposase/invertase (TIGR01784 family)